jgi:putative transcriptional regulator
MIGVERIMFKNNVTALREQKGVCKAHLARRVGVSRSYVTRLEQGRLQPSGKVMFRLAAYFKCDVQDVFQWEPGKAQR